MGKTHSIIDLFCGGGGFSLGAHQSGFRSALSVDIDTNLSSAYMKNFPEATLQHHDLATVTSKRLLEDAGERDIFGIIGGPPCQGFSMMGKRDADDPRNELIGHYFRHIKHIQPAFFIMENVPGLVNGFMREKLEKQLKIISQSYKVVGPLVINAAAMGAATKRSRVIVIGYDPQRIQAFTEQDIIRLCSLDTNTVRDAIYDLPSPFDCNDGDYGWAKLKRETSKLSEYAKAARSAPPKGCGWHVAVDKLEQGIVSGFAATIHTKQVEERFRAVSSGSIDTISRAPKLDWSGLCPTLRAGTGSEKGSYQAVRPLHPVEPRVITVREAARLQGFPDWFVFHPTKWHSFRMIGNSVSPYLSKTLLTFMKQRIIGNARQAA